MKTISSTYVVDAPSQEKSRQPSILLARHGGSLPGQAAKERRLPMAVVADRAFTSRSTLQRIEAGDPAVGIGIYGAVLHALGLLEGLAQLADASVDQVGLELASADLPKRVHLKRPKPLKRPEND